MSVMIDKVKMADAIARLAIVSELVHRLSMEVNACCIHLREESGFGLDISTDEGKTLSDFAENAAAFSHALHAADIRTPLCTTAMDALRRLVVSESMQRIQVQETPSRKVPVPVNLRASQAAETNLQEIVR